MIELYTAMQRNRVHLFFAVLSRSGLILTYLSKKKNCQLDSDGVVLLFDVVDGVSVAFQITQRYQEEKSKFETWCVISWRQCSGSLEQHVYCCCPHLAIFSLRDYCLHLKSKKKPSSWFFFFCEHDETVIMGWIEWVWVQKKNIFFFRFLNKCRFLPTIILLKNKKNSFLQPKELFVILQHFATWS
jgi:hypothetical protein